MKLTILYFAHLADRTGTREESIELPAATTVAALKGALNARHQKLQGALDTCRVAIDEEFADTEAHLKDGQTVAFIPPVSGG
jgi:sulfur-carrier protein